MVEPTDDALTLYLKTHRYFNIDLTPEVLEALFKEGQQHRAVKLVVGSDLVAQHIIVSLYWPRHLFGNLTYERKKPGHLFEYEEVKLVKDRSEGET